VAEFAAAAFRTGPVTVTVDGHDYRFPTRSARWWGTALGEPRTWPVTVLHSAEPDSCEAFLTEVEEGRANEGTLIRLARAVMSEAAGRPWWEAERLCNGVLQSPGLTGEVLLRGVDPDKLTLAAFLAVVWARATQGVQQADRMRMEAELMAPPPEALAEMDDDMDLGAMAQMFRGMQGARVG